MDRSLFNFEVDLQMQSGKSYLVLAQDGFSVSRLIGFQVEMAANNNIPGVINFTVREKDSQVKLFYDLSGLVNLTNYLQRRKLSKQLITDILNRVLQVVLDSKNYFLSEGSFILDVNFIYVDPRTFGVFLLYIPTELVQDITGAFKSLVLDLSFKTAVNFAWDGRMQLLLSRIREEGLSLQDFRNLLQTISDEEHQTAHVQITSPTFEPNCTLRRDVPKNPDKAAIGAEVGIKRTGPVSPDESSPKPALPIRRGFLFILAGVSVLSAIISNYWNELKGFWRLAAGFKHLPLLGVTAAVITLVIIVVNRSGRSRLGPLEGAKPGPIKTMVRSQSKPAFGSTFAEPAGAALSLPFELPLSGETDVLPNTDETTLLDGADWPHHPVLKAIDGSEEIIIAKNEFIVGRNKETCDYAVQNQSIGRAHIRITKFKDAYFIVDLDSKNGTYINGSRLISNKEYGLKAKDKVTLANSEWVFELN